MALAATLLLAACDRSPKRLDPIPAELAPRVELAEQAADDLRSTLSRRLMQTISERGPEAGIEVCANEAKTLTAEVAGRHQVQIGRTSVRLRNRDNSPRPWLGGYLEEAASRPAAEVKPVVYDLGKQLGVAQPLATLPLCTTCHGEVAKIPAPVQAALKRRYPDDRATGFDVGQVRGVLWVEVDKHP